MPTTEYKRASAPMEVLEAKAIGDAKGTVEMFVAVFDVVDFAGDVIRPGAFEKALERLEKIVAEDPELILVVPMGEVSLARQWLQQEFQANAAWSSLTAVQNKHLYLLPKELFHYKPNARWGESYAYLAGLLQEGSRVNPALP